MAPVLSGCNALRPLTQRAWDHQRHALVTGPTSEVSCGG